MKIQYKLQSIKADASVSEKDMEAFVYLLKESVLPALAEKQLLTEQQCGYALEKLKARSNQRE